MKLSVGDAKVAATTFPATNYSVVPPLRDLFKQVIIQ
jgi:hypothetical protein